MDDDRISELPEPILHGILSFLQFDDNHHKYAVQTSVLSKSWRHIWSTNHDFVMNETDFGDDGAQQFMHVLEKTLQGYTDQNLSIHKFDIRISTFNSAPLLQKRIPIVMHNMRVKEFYLHSQRIDCVLDSYDYEYFDLPTVVFESQHLEYMYLVGCDLSGLDSMDTLHLNNLNSLFLNKVLITDDAFEKIISSCPLLEYLNLERCKELTNIKLINKAGNLKFFGYTLVKVGPRNTSIEINVPSIEKIHIGNCSNWSRHQDHFRCLKSVWLAYVRLSTKSFHSFSSNFQSIEELTLWYCYGFKRIQLSSASIKRLSFTNMKKNTNVVAIYAPNIVYFFYHGSLPRFFSFSTTSSKCSSNISFSNEKRRDWLLRLKDVLKALSRSVISLCTRGNDLSDISGCRLYTPVVLEKLQLTRGPSSSSITLGFINGLFSISRPREIRGCKYFENEVVAWHREDNRLTEIMCKILLIEGDDRQMSDWKMHLEEAILEATDDEEVEKGDREVEWCRVDATSWLEPRAALLQNKYVNRHCLRFRLKWREN